MLVEKNASTYNKFDSLSNKEEPHKHIDHMRESNKEPEEQNTNQNGKELQDEWADNTTTEEEKKRRDIRGVY